MRHFIFSITISFFTLVLFTQCTEGDEIGDLYGRWKLVEFRCNATTIQPEYLYIGFQGETYSYQPSKAMYDWGMYEIKGSTFHFKPMQWDADFKAMYLNERSPSFKIDLMNGDNLILSRNDSVWTFKKFL